MGTLATVGKAATLSVLTPEMGPLPDVCISPTVPAFPLLHKGGGPLVYLSMGWKDRAKLLERVQL